MTRPRPSKQIKHRVPRAETERIAEALAERFGLDPERVMCDFEHGAVMVRVEELAALLAVAWPEERS